VLFRAPDLEAAGNLFTQLFTKFDITIMPQIFAAYSEVFMLVLLALVLHLVPVRCQQRMVAYISRGGFVVAVLLLVAVVWMVIQVKASDIQPFIYFQF
jgi:ABC-type transport system involved in cytochrome c biogenesis permease subunit